MKKIWTMLTIISMVAVFASCEEEGPITGNEEPVEIEIEGLEVPEMVAVGEVLAVKGTGFAADAVFTFEKDGAKVEVPATAVEGGVELAVPADMTRDHYALVVAWGGATKTLSDDVWVTIRKALKSVTLGLAGEEYIFSYGWTVTRTDGVITKMVYDNLYATDADSEFENYPDEYVLEGDTYVNTMNESWMAFNKTTKFVEENGLIVSAEAVGNDDELDYLYKWTYDENGYIQNITHNDVEKYSVVYDDAMNVTQILIEECAAAQMTYEGAEQHNHPYAAPVSFGVLSVFQYTFMHHHYPYFNGMLKAETLLPTSIDWQGYDEFYEVTDYVFDEDGYVTKMEWTDSMYSEYSRITFQYE